MKIGASAVPQSTQASQPALQWVRTLSFEPAGFFARISRKIASPWRPIASLTATSSSHNSAARCQARVEPLRRRQLRDGGLHLVERPFQIDRGGPRLVQRRVGGGEAGIARIVAQREADAIGRRRADERRAAHGHVADRLGAFLHRAQVSVLNSCGSSRWSITPTVSSSLRQIVRQRLPW